jgi:hypothetical protein
VTDATDTEALARELLLAACEFDSVGVHASFLAINDLPDEIRAAVLGRVDGLGVRAVRTLAFLWDMSHAEVLDHLTFKPPT